MIYCVSVTPTGKYAIHTSDRDDPIVLNGMALANLTAKDAAGYLYALDLAERARGEQPRNLLRVSVERALASNSQSLSRNVLDIMAAVNWMLPDLKYPPDVLKALIESIAAEHNLILRD